MPADDPIKQLQRAAQAAADHLAPGDPACRVVVFGVSKAKLLDAAICPCAARGAAQAAPVLDVTPGWSERDGRIYFDGTLIPLTGRKLDVLKILVDRESATVDELHSAWGGQVVEESTIRWTVGDLKKSLKTVFGDFPGELIKQAAGGGYALQLR